jgi:methionyl-tRNA synthetase
MEAFAFHEALDAAFGIVREANGFIVEMEPWKLAKDPAQRETLAGVLWSAAEALRILAVLLFPVMPDASERLWSQLGMAERLERVRLDDAARWGGLSAGAKVTKGEALFPRIADER